MRGALCWRPLSGGRGGEGECLVVNHCHIVTVTHSHTLLIVNLLKKTARRSWQILKCQTGFNKHLQ